MNTTQAGRKAERAAALYLEMRGFKVLEQNFRRARCEVDIIATKDGVAHLVEVKYRASNDQGGGLDAITATKLRQMRFAAEIWVQESKWPSEYVLSAIEVEGPTFAILNFMEDVY
ncbi:MAG: putative Ribonuclease [Candidatus Saccharibacteria bacterium]|nr:putative Ribonuclease [Candidatus Saccharibacteria bacterium]